VSLAAQDPGGQGERLRDAGDDHDAPRLGGNPARLRQPAGEHPTQPQVPMGIAVAELVRRHLLQDRASGTQPGLPWEGVQVGRPR
jgi:hypothetical protein